MPLFSLAREKDFLKVYQDRRFGDGVLYSYYELTPSLKTPGPPFHFSRRVPAHTSHSIAKVYTLPKKKEPPARKPQPPLRKTKRQISLSPEPRRGRPWEVAKPLVPDVGWDDEAGQDAGPEELFVGEGGDSISEEGPDEEQEAS